MDLANSAGMTPAQREQLEQLIARVTALEGSGGSSGSLSVQGLGSIIVNGVDIVQIYLDGDSDAPGPSWYYGSGPDGAKGWYAIADSLAVTSDLTKAVDAGTGVATLGLGDLPDSGAGAALRKITRDSKGRLAGTSAATTDDLPESGTPTNQWFTAARVRAVALTGLATAVNAAIAATDSVLAAFGKLQAQITGLGTSKADKTTTISTTAPLGGGGDLSANRTLTISAATTSAAGSMSAADKVLLDGIVAWSPSALAGLVLIYVSGTSLTVSAGACHIQSLGRVLVFPGALTLSGLSLSASTFYHVYAYLNASTTAAIELVTTAPAAAYFGDARGKTGDASRRYLGSVLTDGAGAIIRFVMTSQGLVSYTNPGTGGIPFRVLANKQTAAEVSINLASVVPVTANAVTVRQFFNRTVADNASSLGPASGQYLNNVSSPGVSFLTVPLLGQSVYATLNNNVTDGNGGMYVDVQGYSIAR
ncbi:hypothetical protein [Xanthomonas citri]|uniref:hypothetical protein n=1 Tax=Xanthomonas citri TaxID=346 RepID=UPI001A8D87B1|nr:hypothetical protein [Xanthomonas citri]MCC8492277.1 hypothetical protein [Xanthomonas citri pv. fuscans]